MQEYRKAVALIQARGLAPLTVPRPDANMITALEQRLGVLLPPSYRAMLSDFGILAVETLEIAGLGNAGLDGQSAVSVVFATEKERAAGQIAPTMVRIASSGYGPIFVLECAEAGADGEAPVYEVAPGGVKQGKDKVAVSFGEFLLVEAQRMIELLDEDVEADK